MTVVPARVAGVAEVVVASPRPTAVTLAAAHVAGADRLLAVGGAQAIAALAFGCGVPRVDMVVGPGNRYVTAAKRCLVGEVGIDGLAGPSELLVLADATADARWIAADLLAQAEHDVDAVPVLVTTARDLVPAVLRELELQLADLPTADVARAALRNNGRAIVARDASEAIAVADALAPEHVEIAVDDPQPLFDMMRHAGSAFLGRYTPEAIGDYVAGPNHVLPTGRRARFASGLGVTDFMKRTSFLQLDAAALAKLGPATVALAEAEGLPAHAQSVARRL
jgi:histidinol dehydrogenase